MGEEGTRRCSRACLLLSSATAVAVLFSATAAAQPVNGPHVSVDNRLSTTRPNASAGFHYVGTYHAAGDPKGDPPYMRKMRSYNPDGLRYDTSVPARCTASDLELAANGAAACPPGSKIGGGTVQTKLMGFPRTEVKADIFNNTGEQIIVVGSPGAASVTRGHIYPDGSIQFAAPTCFPTPPVGPCAVDNALQLGSNMTVRPISKRAGRKVRNYLTTPRKCPASGKWKVPIRFWWADGTIDTVVSKQPCKRPRRKRGARRA